MKKKPLSEAQKKQRKLYSAQQSTPKKPSGGFGECRALHKATGLGVGR